MNCYKGQSYCAVSAICRDGYKCSRAVTREVIDGARESGLPICQSEFPECFVPFFEEK